ncbi:MAG: CDP-alcohol phosphatidyltransferase family protein [Gemmatimonadota bacterium]|nr:CDP-alcohol phosphatidyltransferase family protein [Gemmatimonadota bacterium]
MSTPNLTATQAAPPPTNAAHTRDNRGVLADLEKRTLIWIAHRLPGWMHSDHLSALGLLGMVGVGAAFAAGGTYKWALPLVVIALAVNWFGDSLDGTLARVRNHQRPRYGYYVDHALDIIGTVFMFGGMAVGGVMTPVVAMALLAVYYAVMAEVFLATKARGVFRMSFMGFGPTELRVVLSVGALALLRDPSVTIAGVGPFQLFDVGGVVAIGGLAVAFLVSAISNGRALYAEEPLPGRTAPSAKVDQETALRVA